MLKSEAIQILGGDRVSAAREIGITPQAVGQWPDELTPPIRDRVQAALWRRHVARQASDPGEPVVHHDESRGASNPQ